MYYLSCSYCSKHSLYFCLWIFVFFMFTDALSEQVVIGEDSGCISLLSLAEIEDEDGSRSTHVVINVATYDHDSAVMSLSVSPDKNSIVSGSMDKWYVKC